jgi:oligopeptide/dipeptide ABC transporter ATP-binding protein
VDTIFNQPRHPYTKRLIDAFPDVDQPNSSLASIPGHPPPLNDLPPGCRFEPRCHRRLDICTTVSPPLTAFEANHLAACYNPEPQEELTLDQ